jgi:hypothetical protein
MGHLKTIQLNLRILSIDITRPATLDNAVTNIVGHSPDFHLLSVRGTTGNEWMTKLGDRIKHLRLWIEGAVPPISCKWLKGLNHLSLIPAICSISLILQFVRSLPSNNFTHGSLQYRRELGPTHCLIETFVLHLVPHKVDNRALFVEIGSKT